MKRAILCVAVMVSICSAALAADETPRVWVVAVGVSKYVQSFQPLAYASDGARKLAQALLSAQPLVTKATILATDSTDPSQLPTKANVMRELKQLAQKVKQGDLVIFCFCGHGVEASGQQLLLMMDADLSDNDAVGLTTVSLSWLREKLEALPCNGRLLWLDACRESAQSLRVSGGAGNAGLMTRDFLTTGGGWQPQPGRVSATLFGCKEGEKVYHGRNGSFFTEALVAGLGGKAADAEGQVTLNSLTQYVKKNVPEAVAEELGASAKQEPVLIPTVVSDVVLRPGVGYIACLAFDGEQGDLFSETVQTRLASSAAIHLVERMRLKDALTELKLQDTALVDASSARKLGNLLGAKYVLVGSSRKGPDGKFHVNARLVVAETGLDVPGVAARCSAEPKNWEPAVMAMANDLLKRMRGPVLPENTLEVQRLSAAKDTPAAKGSVRINEKDGSKVVLIPAGEFIMGDDGGHLTLDEMARWPKSAFRDEKPAHRVYLDAYEIGKYEVTVAQYREFCEATGGKMPRAPKWGWKDDHPIVDVTWNDAAAYCRWAGGRLPTEAEWEKAARGTDGRKWPWGNTWDQSKCSDPRPGLKPTMPVGAYPSGASPYGCMDMAGNVFEWCADWYADDYYRSSPSRNPGGPSSGSYRVLRGGAWVINEYVARCACRSSKDDPYGYSYAVGFRLAR